MRIAWFWFLLALGTGFAFQRVADGGPERYLGELLDIPFVIAFAVAWHRATLLGEMPGGWIAGHLGRRELRYAGWVALLMLGAFVIVVVGAAATSLLIGEGNGQLQIAVVLVLLVTVIWLSTRFILVLPAVALGNEAAGLRWSWRLTRGHGTALFLAFCAVSLPILVLKYCLVFVSGSPLALDQPATGPYEFLLWQPLYRLLDFINMAVSIAFMSFAYGAFARR